MNDNPPPFCISYALVQRVEQPMIVAGTCSLVERMYVTAKPGVTTLVMAEKHTKTKSTGVQGQAECCYEREDSSQA